MSPQRINASPGERLEIIAPCGVWPRWQAAQSAARELGVLLGVEIIIRAADAGQWRGTWKDGRPR